MPRPRSKLSVGTLAFAVTCCLAASVCQSGERFETPDAGGDLSTVQRQRLAMPAVREVLRGALLFLDDTQVRDRPGRRSSYFDWCGDRDTDENAARHAETTTPQPGATQPVRGPRGAAMGRCRRHIFITRRISQRLLALPAFGLDTHNEIGEWSTLLGAVPDIPGNRAGRIFIGGQDSTMFVTAAVGYPLFLFDAPPDGALAEMLALARGNIARYRRDNAYNFWLQRPAVTGSGEPYTAVFPRNVPVDLLEKYARLFAANPDRYRAFTSKLTPDQRDGLLAWVRALLDESTNPHGAVAAGNIPNDVDDTSTAAAFGILYRSHGRLPDADERAIDVNAVSLFARFRDLNRSTQDSLDTWKGVDSGAFLTWLKDEDGPTFARPDTGVIPRAANNVDCVVNANALLALGLAGTTNTPGYRDALRLMVRAVEQRAWPECGIYYPQRMIFPYALSRAWRDGGATSPALENALGTLMRDVLAQQSPDGWFDGGFDRSRHLSTALAVVALLNLGEKTALASAIPAADYHEAIAAGLGYLYRHRRERSLRNADTFARGRTKGRRHDVAVNWEAGVFFTPAFRIAQWRSEAYTTAIVLEAFARYALGYDKHAVGIRDGPRIEVDEARLDFRIAAPLRGP